jgi:hypothetical protein
VENQLVFAAVREKGGRAVAGVLVLPWERRGDFHRRWRAMAPRRPTWKRVKKKTLAPMVGLVDAFLGRAWLSFRWRAGGRDQLAQLLLELDRGGTRRLRVARDGELAAWLERELVDENGIALFGDVRSVDAAASPPIDLLALLLAAMDAAARQPKSRAKRRLSAHVGAALAS